MNWYIIVMITLGIYWIIGSVITAIDEDLGLYWAVGLVYPLLMVLLYPVRAWRTYTHSSGYYEKHNISRLQFMFGKRVHKRLHKRSSAEEGEDDE